MQWNIIRLILVWLAFTRFRKVGGEYSLNTLDICFDTKCTLQVAEKYIKTFSCNGVVLNF